MTLVMVNGCAYHFVTVPSAELSRTSIRDSRTRATFPGDIVVELDLSTMRYPILRGRVRSVRRPGGDGFAVGSEVAIDVRLLQQLQVQRIDETRTALTVLGVLGGVAVTLVLLGVAWPYLFYSSG